MARLVTSLIALLIMGRPFLPNVSANIPPSPWQNSVEMDELGNMPSALTTLYHFIVTGSWKYGGENSQIAAVAAVDAQVSNVQKGLFVPGVSLSTMQSDVLTTAGATNESFQSWFGSDLEIGYPYAVTVHTIGMLTFRSPSIALAWFLLQYWTLPNRVEPCC
jgi:hypothetical protein